jgi:hypothetical protein
VPYDLTPVNSEAGTFRFGAFSFPVLLEACGYLFACVHAPAKWYCVYKADERMIGCHPDGSGQAYPAILGSGFDATDEEACMMARMARNFVAVQRALPEDHRTQDMRSKPKFDRADLMELLTAAMAGGAPGPWPAKVRDDFTARIEQFAEWAPRSGGFHVTFNLTVRVTSAREKDEA